MSYEKTIRAGEGTLVRNMIITGAMNAASSPRHGLTYTKKPATNVSMTRQSRTWIGM